MQEYSVSMPTDMPCGLFAQLSISDGEAHTSPDYHPSTVGPNDAFLGKMWTDMPGNSEEDKRMNFCLFRRGLFDLPKPGERKCIGKIFGGRNGKRVRRAA